jgi:hypothetical protein
MGVFLQIRRNSYLAKRPIELEKFRLKYFLVMFDVKICICMYMSAFLVHFCFYIMDVVAGGGNCPSNFNKHTLQLNNKFSKI